VSDLFRHRNTALWAALVAATCIPLASGAAHGVKLAATGALLIAFLKARYIGLEFMELRHAPAVLRHLFEVWVVVVGATVMGIYLIA
jgi:hypothetical protein